MTKKEAELTKNIVDDKLQLLKKLKNINKSQTDLMKIMGKEKCDDIHSVLRSKEHADAIVKLEVKKQLLIDLLSKN